VTLFTVRADGWATQSVDRDDLDSLQWDILGAGGQAEGVVVVLGPGLTVEGTVVDDGGAPVAGVFVLPGDSRGSVPERELEDPWNPLQTAPSGEDGRFHIEGLDPLTVKCVFASLGRQVTGPYALDPEAVESGRATLDLTVPAPRQIEVRIRVLGDFSDVVWGVDDEHHPSGADPGGAVGTLEIGWHRLWIHGTRGCANLPFEVPALGDSHCLEVDPAEAVWESDPRRHVPWCPPGPPPDPDTGSGE
jgi:hypothetical protein